MNIFHLSLVFVLLFTNVPYSKIYLKGELSGCEKIPCKNGGICIDKLNSFGFECICSDEFSGYYCEKSLSQDTKSINLNTTNKESNKNRDLECLNGGKIDKSRKNCLCPDDFEGPKCEKKIFDNLNICKSECQIGECTATYNGFICKCFLDYSGSKCDENQDSDIDSVSTTSVPLLKKEVFFSNVLDWILYVIGFVAFAVIIGFIQLRRKNRCNFRSRNRNQNAEKTDSIANNEIKNLTENTETLA